MGKSSRDVANGLRALAARLDQMPERNVTDSLTISEYRYTGTDAARSAFIDELKTLGSFRKVFTNEYFKAVMEFDGGVGFYLFADRSSVCTKRTVTKEVTVDEWDCDSVLDKALAAEGITSA